MNLPLDVSRCLGEYQDHWEGKIEPCARRDQCARYVVRPWDAAMGRQAFTMAHCVDERLLTAFIHVDEIEIEGGE